jgi:Family of unknown function (DUF5996)
MPYEAVRTAADPDRTLLEFLHTTYRAAAERGGFRLGCADADVTAASNSHAFADIGEVPGMEA